MVRKKSLLQLILLASLTAVFLDSGGPAPVGVTPSLAADDSAIDSPALPPKTDLSRAQRKPAVEPRVYVEDASSKTGFVYYDYADQAAPPVSQKPPAPMVPIGALSATN